VVLCKKWCYAVKPPLIATYTFAAVATVATVALLASVSVVVTTVIVLVLFLLVHLVPLLQAPLPALGRRVFWLWLLPIQKRLT
jgi:hypothetical protein